MSGIVIDPNEQSAVKQNIALKQLAEGRSNAVGTLRLTGDGAATTTTVTAMNCGTGSSVLLFPATAHAAAVVATTYVKTTDVKAGQFTVTHATTSNNDMTFYWVALG